MEILEMGKDMEIRFSVSSPPTKYGGNFSLKKALYRRTNLFGQIYEEMFYMGNNDQILQGGS